MTTTAIPNAHDTTPERVLFVAFERSEKTWKRGCTTGHGQKPHTPSDGHVTDVHFMDSHRQPTLIALDTQPKDDVMQLDRAGQANRLAG